MNANNNNVYSIFYILFSPYNTAPHFAAFLFAIFNLIVTAEQIRVPEVLARTSNLNQNLCHKPEPRGFQPYKPQITQISEPL